MSIENIYNQKIKDLAKLFNLTFKTAEKFFLAGMKEILNKEDVE